MKNSFRIKLTAATPLLCLITFLILGFADDIGFSDKPLWHPGWIVFLLIPIVPVLLGTKKIISIWPAFCVIIFLIIGFAFDKWHPGWIIFLTIPLVGIFTTGKKQEE